MPRTDIARIGKRRPDLPPDSLRGTALRDALVEVAGSQAKFAGLLGISPNSVSGMIRRGAPGYVMAYLKLAGEFRSYRQEVERWVETRPKR